MDPSFEIVQAADADAPALLALIAKLYADEAIAFRPEPMAAALSKLLADPALTMSAPGRCTRRWALGPCRAR